MGDEKKRYAEKKVVNCGGGAIYGLGTLGALYYFFQNTVTFSDKALALLKAFIWPAFLVAKLLAFFHA